MTNEDGIDNGNNSEEHRFNVEDNELNKDGIISCLKVKADPDDISPEERKKSVKKLAGAISHSLRGRGEINVRAFGHNAIAKAARALAIARGYIGIQNLQLECSPSFISTKIGDTELTGICFVTFASERPQDTQPVDVKRCKSVLMVRADAEDTPPEIRKENVKKLAYVISYALKEHKETLIKCLGYKSVGKVSKAIAIARGIVASSGPDLYCWPEFVNDMVNGVQKGGVAFFAYTNES